MYSLRKNAINEMHSWSVLIFNTFYHLDTRAMPLNITNEILFAPINIKLFFSAHSIIICATSSNRKFSTFAIQYRDKLFLFFKYHNICNTRIIWTSFTYINRKHYSNYLCFISRVLTLKKGVFSLSFCYLDYFCLKIEVGRKLT